MRRLAFLCVLFACAKGEGPLPDSGVVDKAEPDLHADAALLEEGAQNEASYQEIVFDAFWGEQSEEALFVTAVVPGKGLSHGGETVTIQGGGFLAGLSVIFDKSASPYVVVVDSKTARAVTPPHPPGVVSVTVVRSDGATATLEAGFVYANRTEITGVEPKEISIRGGTPVTVLGSGFLGGAKVLVDGRLCPVTHVTDDGHLLAITPEGERLGPVDVIVVGDLGQAILPSGLYYKDEPYKIVPDLGIAFVTPSVGPAAGGTVVEVVGAGFSEGAEVFFGGLAASAVQVLSVDRIRAKTPPGSPGLATVLVRVLDKEAALIGGFEYEAQSALYAVAPETGASVGGTLVRLFGSGFSEGARVFFGAEEAGHVVVESKTRISCRTPPGPEGAVDVKLFLDEQMLLLPKAFTYFDPTGFYGGTWGGPVAGTLNVVVLDATNGTRLQDAYVIVGNDPTTPYQGYTGPDGVIVFSGLDLQGPVTVTASKECYNTASTVAFNAENVTLYLQYICPTPGGFPPMTPVGRVSGRVLGFGKYVIAPPGNCWYLGVGEDGVSCLPCWSQSDCAWAGASCEKIGDTGTFCAKPCISTKDCLEGYVCMQVAQSEGTYCIPEPGRKTAICKATQPDIFTEGVDPGEGSEVNAQLEYSILVLPGDMAIVCLGGFRDAFTNEFKPYAMGVRRHVHVNPAEEVKGIDVLIDLPMDRSFRIYLDNPPKGPAGPDFNYALIYYDFKSDGVFPDTWSIPFAFGDPKIEVKMQPRAFIGDLSDVTYTFIAGAFSLTSDNTPFSVTLHQDVADLQDDTMFRLDGSTLSVVRTGVRKDVFGMWGESQASFFAVGQDGVVLHFNGFGFSAQPVEGATGATLRAVSGHGSSFAVAVGDGGEVVKFDGTAWRRETVPIAQGRDLTGIACGSSDDCFAVAYGFAMHWDGKDWAGISGVPYGFIYGVASIGPMKAVAVGAGGRVLWLSPQGAEVEQVGVSTALRAVARGPDGFLWIVGDNGMMVRGGKGKWQIMESGVKEALYAVFRQAERVVAFGDAGVVLLADSDGHTTMLKVPGYAPDLRAAFASPEGPIFAMGISQLSLGPFLQVPRVLYPLDGGMLTKPYIEFTSEPGIPASMHYILVAIPGLFGDIPVWEFIAPGDVYRVEMPDLENLAAIAAMPSGTPLKLTILRSLIPGFSINHFDYLDLHPLRQEAWSADITTFVKP